MNNETKSAKKHFFNFVEQVGNAAVLMKKLSDGTLESLFISKEFARLMECSITDAKKMINGAGFTKTTHIEDRLQEKRILRRRVADDGSRELTLRKLTAKGNIIWCIVRYAFINDFGNQFIYCTYFDVTATKEYEKRLRTAYMSLGYSFYRNSSKTLGMFRINLDNDRIEDMQGQDLFSADSMMIPFSEVIKQRSQNFPIDSERKIFLDTFDRISLISEYLKGNVHFSLMLYSKRRDDRYCYVNYDTSLTRHPLTGEIVAFITEHECNSEKVRKTILEKILVRQFDMVCYIVNGSYGVVTGDPANIKYGSLFPLSRNGEYAEWLNNQVFPTIKGSEEEQQKVREALSLPYLARNVSADKPCTISAACEINGETHFKQFDFYKINSDAEFYILVKSDFTEVHRKQEERNQQLAQALEEAKQASVAKTAFLSRMSHEIRTPMNAIIGLDNIALHESNLSPTIKTSLEKIGSSAKYLLSLINDILDMSRIESGKMTLKKEEFSFSSFLDQVNTVVDGQCRDKGLNYECTVNGKIDEYYIGDDTKLKQIMINILGNSVKFTDKGGKVSFIVEKTAHIKDQTGLRFLIKDTGIGMDKAYLPKIFEAFSQEDGTTTSSYGGSGLGLAITKNIVEMMNGTITVDSEKGKGTVFTVNITLKNSDRRSSNNNINVNLQDMKVLIVDDDEIACRHAKTVLEEAGISSDTALSGTAALEMIQLQHARRNEYDLMLIDFKMPEQDGIALSKEIRKLLGNNTAIIMLTSYSRDDIYEDAIKAGVDKLLAKPLFASEVINELKSALSDKENLPNKQTSFEAKLEGCKILLAEDMFINAEIMKELLSMREIEAEHAENGKIAVEMFEKSPVDYYDAVLMDVRMPEMDGLQAAEAIRKLNRDDSKVIPIIAMTANAFDEDVQRSLQAGMDAHLSKPVEPEHMYKTLSELIGKRRAKSTGKNSRLPMQFHT